jgi:hypothetical protein
LHYEAMFPAVDPLDVKFLAGLDAIALAELGGKDDLSFTGYPDLHGV